MPSALSGRKGVGDLGEERRVRGGDLLGYALQYHDVVAALQAHDDVGFAERLRALRVARAEIERPIHHAPHTGAQCGRPSDLVAATQ